MTQVPFRLEDALLNPEQYDAVTHRDGPMLVLAGAGSGKTRVIAHRVAYLMSTHVPPEAIVAVSFTNKAAAEMRHRVAGLVTHEFARRCKLSTFHALGAEILRRDISALGFRTPFAILDMSDQRSIIREILKESRKEHSRTKIDEALSIVSKAKMAFCEPSDLPGMRFNPLRPIANRVHKAYNRTLRAWNAVDFDDLISLPVHLFEQHPDILAKYHTRWRYVMVDEYQDTNHTQYELLRLLAGERKNVGVVGDDDQSIYGFRGADATHILGFENHFPGAKVVTLEQNYRSSKIILEAANAVIVVNETRREKELWSDGERGPNLRYFQCRDEEDEASFVAEEIERYRFENQLNYRDMAILYRINPQSGFFEQALVATGIPYRVVGGTSLYDRSEVRDLIHYLRACVNTSDELAVRRILNVPPRGVGPTTLAIIDDMARERHMTFFGAIKKVVADGEVGNKRTKKGLREFVALIEHFHRRFEADDSPTELAKQLIATLRYVEYLQSSTTKTEVVRRRVENVARLIGSLNKFETWDEGRERKQALVAFLERVAMEPPEPDDKDLDNDEVVLMTLHASKGLEFPCVFMVGCEEGLLPHERSEGTAGISEERRLAYVGITRAKRFLTLTSCAQRRRMRELVHRRPSRFLADIPDSVIDRSTWQGSAASERKQEHEQKRTRKKLDALWDAITGNE